MARLVGKYGRALIVHAAKRVGIPRHGPPTNLAKWELLAEFARLKADLRAEGVHAYADKARRKLFEKDYPPIRRTDENFRKFSKRLDNYQDLWSKTNRTIKAGRKARSVKGPSNSPAN